MSKKFILIFYVTRGDLYIDLLQNIRPWPRYTSSNDFENSSFGICRSAVLTFSLIASIVSNHLPFNGLLRWWKSQKSHGARSGEYSGCSATVILFRNEFLNNWRFVAGCIVLMKDPSVCPLRWSFAADVFFESTQNCFVEGCIHHGARGYEFMMHNSVHVKKKQSTLSWFENAPFVLFLVLGSVGWWSTERIGLWSQDRNHTPMTHHPLSPWSNNRGHLRRFSTFLEKLLRDLLLLVWENFWYKFGRNSGHF